MDLDRRYAIYASYCFFAMAAIGAIKYFFLPVEMFRENWAVIIFNIAFFTGLGLLVRQGYSWTKYVLAILCVASLFRLDLLIKELSNPTIPGINVLIDIVLLLCATLILFAGAPKQTRDETSKE
jgi:hypothetical protein